MNDKERAEPPALKEEPTTVPSEQNFYFPRDLLLLRQNRASEQGARWTEAACKARPALSMGKKYSKQGRGSKKPSGAHFTAKIVIIRWIIPRPHDLCILVKSIRDLLT